MAKSFAMDTFIGSGGNSGGDFMKRLTQNAVRASVSAGLDMALYGTDFKDALRSAAVNTVADTVAQELSEKIGLEYGKDDSALNYATHKVAHGAVGAVIGEVITDAQKEKIQDQIKNRLQDLQSSGQTITRETIQAVAQEEAASVVKGASFGAAVAAFAAGKDPNIASGSAVTAMENNFVHTLAFAPEIAAFVTETLTVAAGAASALVNKKEHSGEGPLPENQDVAKLEKEAKKTPNNGEALQDWSTSFRAKEDALPTTLTTPIHENGSTTLTTPVVDPLPNIFATPLPEENKPWTVSTPIGEIPGPTILWTPAQPSGPTTFFN